MGAIREGRRERDGRDKERRGVVEGMGGEKERKEMEPRLALPPTLRP
jgi:hypothetical protein